MLYQHGEVMRKIFTELAPSPVGPYSQAVVSGNLVFVSGQIGIDKNGNLASGIREQTVQALKNMEAILNASGASKCSILKTTIYLKEISTFKVVNEIYSDFFSNCPVFPARSTVEVSNLPLNALVELECIAWIG
jgi:2-iminobutanoate/2-iminopropanoate deaminase